MFFGAGGLERIDDVIYFGKDAAIKQLSSGRFFSPPMPSFPEAQALVKPDRLLTKATSKASTWRTRSEPSFSLPAVLLSGIRPHNMDE